MTDPRDPLAHLLERVHARHLGLRDGSLAAYIPELATVDPEPFGLALATTDGRVVTAGDADREFTIQSVSKPLVHAMALEDRGRDVVLRHVGVEPSGDAFNAIVMDPVSGLPYNPLVNAGAIATAGLIEGPDPARRFLARLSGAAGRPLTVDTAVYASEQKTGHRNRAIAHLLRGAGVIGEDVDAVLDLYFLQCSIRVTARDLAMIGATLANLGTNPVTGADVFRPDDVRDVLAVMLTCGMYDYSGAWVLRVGIPAKSGVGGGVLGVVNRQLGIGTYSPRVDARGNSVRGIAAFVDIADELGLHLFDPLNAGSSFLRAVVPTEV